MSGDGMQFEGGLESSGLNISPDNGQEIERKFVQAWLSEHNLVAVSQDRMDIDCDIESLQGWIYGRSDAINYEDQASTLCISKNDQLCALRKERRAMIAAAQEQGDE